MPLSVAKPFLEQAILNSFEKALQTGKNAGEEDKSSQIRQDLAKDLSNAIHDYVNAAQVNIASVVSAVPPGVPVATAGTAVAQAGATVAPGIAQHAGFGSLQ